MSMATIRNMPHLQMHEEEESQSRRNARTREKPVWGTGTCGAKVSESEKAGGPGLTPNMPPFPNITFGGSLHLRTEDGNRDTGSSETVRRAAAAIETAARDGRLAGALEIEDHSPIQPVGARSQRSRTTKVKQCSTRLQVMVERGEAAAPIVNTLIAFADQIRLLNGQVNSMRWERCDEHQQMRDRMIECH